MKLEAGVSVMPERHLLLAEEDDEGAEGADEPPWGATHSSASGHDTSRCTELRV